MPKGTVEARRKAIEDAGASTVVITDLNYDKTVAYAEKMAQEKGWILVQDTSWEGYEEVPRRIIEGYLTMAAEIENQTEEDRPTHIFLQAGICVNLILVNFKFINQKGFNLLKSLLFSHYIYFFNLQTIILCP